MAVVAERDQIRERVLVAAFGKRLDVVNLQSIGRATLPTPFAIALPRSRSRLLPLRAVTGTALDAVALVVGPSAGTAPVTDAGSRVVVLAAVDAELEDHAPRDSGVVCATSATVNIRRVVSSSSYIAQSYVS